MTYSISKLRELAKEYKDNLHKQKPSFIENSEYRSRVTDRMFVITDLLDFIEKQEEE